MNELIGSEIMKVKPFVEAVDHFKKITFERIVVGEGFFIA